MILRQALFLILIFTSASAWSGEIQFTAGATSTTYDDVPDAKTWGFSLRTQYNFSNAESGWIVNYYGPAGGLVSGELGVGYEWKTTGSFYVEGGLGVAQSGIFGTHPMAVAGFGYRVSQNVFLDFPIMLTSSVAFLPYIGVSF